MPGPLSRILSRRADGAPPPAPRSAEAQPADSPTGVVVAEASPETADGPAPAPAPAPADDSPTADAPATEQPTVVVPVVIDAGAEPAATDETPAGAEPEAVAAPSFRDRGRLRRRLRYLRRVRELGLRDLGGLVFDLHRFERERPDLVQAKLEALAGIDHELRVLEVALDDVRHVEELEEPGVASCSTCGALHGSEARFCPACGTRVGTTPPVAPLELPDAAPEAPAPEQPAA